MKAIRRLAFVVNRQKTGAHDLARDLVAVARKRKVEVSITDHTPLPEGHLDGWDACCVIGGDGTLLSAVREAARHDVPLIGVNRGSLGFLTTFSAEEARTSLAAVLAGDYRLARRSLLACRTGPHHDEVALNDVVLKDEVNSKLVRLGVYANDEFVTDFYGDGLIFSTPTGSTAYNLSAGGPIIHPAADVIAMTPICPHTLSNRSVIFRDDVRIRVESPMDDAKVLVALDGQRNLFTCFGTPIEISIAPRPLTLVQRADYEHFEVLRTKLAWSGAAHRPARG